MHTGHNGNVGLPVQQKPVEPGIVHQCHAEAAQNLESNARCDIECHAQKPLVIGKTEADGHGRIKAQTQAEGTQYAQKQQFHGEGRAVGHQIQVVYPDCVVQQIQEAVPQITHKTDVKGHDAAGETDHHNSGGEPDGRDDELAPDLLVDAYRKGHHYVALVLQEIFVKPVDHQHKRDDSHGEDPHDEQHDEDGTQRAQEGTVRIQHTPAGEIGTHRHQQQDAEQGQHDPAGGPELMLPQLSQHLNTSRNSVSTLMPFSSRI